MTQRTKTALDTLFADNTSKNITPSNLRDFLESCAPSSASMYISTPAATSIAIAGTFVKVAGTTTLEGASRFTSPSANRLRYDGPADDVTAVVTASLSFTSASDNQVLAFAIAKNGTVVTSSIVRLKALVGTDVRTAVVAARMTLDPTDYFEVWCANDTSDADLTVTLGQVVVTAFLG